MSLSSLGSCFGTDNKVTVPDITECRFCKKCVQPSNELKRRLHESSEGQEPWGDVEFLQRHLRGDTSSTTLSQQVSF